MGTAKLSKKATIAIIVCVYVVVAVAVVMAVVVSNAKKHNGKDDTWIADEQSVTEMEKGEYKHKVDYQHKNNTEEYKQFARKQYAPVITSYRTLARNDFYRGSSGGIDYDEYEDYIDPGLLDELQDYDEDGDVYYALYDFDDNGVPELFVGTPEGSDYRLFDVFTYANGKIYKIPNAFEGIEYYSYVVYPTGRVMLTSYEDGDPDAGETTEFYTFYKINDDGHTFDVDGSFRINASDYGDKYYYVSPNGKETEYDEDEFDSLYCDYAGESLRSFHYDCACIDLDWKLLSLEDEDDEEFIDYSDYNPDETEEPDEDDPGQEATQEDDDQDDSPEETTQEDPDDISEDVTEEESDYTDYSEEETDYTEEETEPEEETTEVSYVSEAEAEQIVLDYFNSNYSENGTYVIFDHETKEDEDGYTFTVRLQPKYANADTGTNLLAATAYVDKSTGVMQIED